MANKKREAVCITASPEIAKRFEYQKEQIVPENLTEAWARRMKTYGRVHIAYTAAETAKAEAAAARIGKARCVRILVNPADIPDMHELPDDTGNFTRNIYVPSRNVYLRLAERSKAGETPGLRIPCEFVDGVTGRLLPGNTYVLFSQPKVGKTRFSMAHIAIPLARGGSNVLFWSLEIDPDELHEQTLMPVLLGREYPDGGWTQADFDKAAALQPPTLFIGQSLPNTPYTEALRQAQDECEVLGVNFMILDNAGFIVRGGHNKNSYEAEGDLSKLLKDFACSVEIPILVICHPRKEQEQTGEKDPPPTLYDVKGNSALVADATGIFCLHRPRIVDPDNPVMQRRSPLTYFYSVVGRNKVDGLSNELYFCGGTFEWRRATEQEIIDGLPDHGRYEERKKTFRIYEPGKPKEPKISPSAKAIKEAAIDMKEAAHIFRESGGAR